jgi:hypothetical protein
MESPGWDPKPKKGKDGKPKVDTKADTAKTDDPRYPDKVPLITQIPDEDKKEK